MGRDLYREHWSELARAAAQLFWERRPELLTPQAGFALWLKECDSNSNWICLLSSDPNLVDQRTPSEPPHRFGEWSRGPGGRIRLGMIFDGGRSPLALSLDSAYASSPEVFVELAERAYLECLNGRLSELCGGLLELLAMQRVRIGRHLHRGPAQGLTAARIELSLLDEAAQPQAENLRLALESAGSQLQRLVHGYLRPPTMASEQNGLTLDSLLKELVHAQDWRGQAASVDGQLSEGEVADPLLLSEAEPVLLKGWTLLGGGARQDQETSFRLARPRTGATTRGKISGSPFGDGAS